MRIDHGPCKQQKINHFSWLPSANLAQGKLHMNFSNLRLIIRSNGWVKKVSKNRQIDAHSSTLSSPLVPILIFTTDFWTSIVLLSQKIQWWLDLISGILILIQTTSSLRMAISPFLSIGNLLGLAPYFSNLTPRSSHSTIVRWGWKSLVKLAPLHMTVAASGV